MIALIDGTFNQTLSVWQKEILYARERGVTVAGASSMGALRAAECAPYGMVGVGAVYELFASGTLDDDDEVAVAHAGAEYGYRPLSEAMVNVRATVDAATAGGVLSGGDARVVTGAAKSLFFPDRTWPAIVAGAARDGLPAPVAGALEDFVRAGRVPMSRPTTPGSCSGCCATAHCQGRPRAPARWCAHRCSMPCWSGTGGSHARRARFPSKRSPAM